MAGDGNAKAAGSAINDACPACNEPLICPNAACSSSLGASSLKRPAGASPRSVSAAKQKLRRRDTDASDQSARKWNSVENYPVWVHVYDPISRTRGWEPGRVANVYETGDPKDYKIAVQTQNEKGEWGLPRTFNERNHDPIPSVVPSNPRHQLKDYIIERDENMEGLSNLSGKLYRCLKFHCGKAAELDNPYEADIIGESLLDEDAQCPTSLRRIIRSLMVNERVQRVVTIATKETSCSPQHALAYLLGQLCGIELSESTVGVANPGSLLDRMARDDNGVNCPISQVFLVSAMSVHTHKSQKFDPTEPLYDSRARAVLSDPVKLKARLGRLETAMAALHSSQTDRPSLSGPALALLDHGISMMIDMRGTSDPLLEELAAKGLCRHPRVLRYWIQRLAEAIDPLHTRSPPPAGQSHILAWVADNANYRKFRHEVNCVGVGNLLIGHERVEDTVHLNANLFPGMGKLSEVDANDLAATAVDDQIAEDALMHQNILALLTADVEDGALDAQPAANRTRAANPPRQGTEVSFVFRSEERRGHIMSYTGNVPNVKFYDGAGETIKPIPLSTLSIVDIANPSDGHRIEGARDEEDTAMDDAASPAPETFGGERYRFHPTTTLIASVLSGLSSKNNETARQVIQQVIAEHGEEEFNKAVHVIVADQEFMPTMIADFFAKLGGEDELPIIPCLAVGHAMKGLSVSMMSFYKCFFDPIMAAIGYKEGSPAYSRLYKGTVIRETNTLVTNCTEMLAVAVAHKYLSAVGNDERIDNGAGALISPMSLIKAYYRVPDSTAHTVVVMDPNGRPQQLVVTESIVKVARDFKRWVHQKWGTAKRAEVGPSGFQKPSPHADPQEADYAQQQLSQRIEAAPEYPGIFASPYTDDDNTQGLLSLCTNEELLGKSSRKDRATLAKKLFLLFVEHDREAAMQFGPARKVPSGTNFTGLVLYDLLFGVERFAIVKGHLLTRVRPPDPEANERYPTEWLVFFKALTASTFTRYQPNYQRLSLSFLIQLQLILNHNDARCTDLTLKRIRWTMSVSEFGDSHKCEAADMFQERTVIQKIKGVGTRDPSSTQNLEARVKVASFMRLRKVEARASVVAANFATIQPARSAQAGEEQRHCHCIVATWANLLREMDSSDDDVDSDTILGIGNENSRVKFVCKSRVFFRFLDATDHILVAGSAFIKGYRNGYEVAIPPRPYTILRQLHRVVRKKAAKTQSTLAKVKKGSDDLSSYPDRSELLTGGGQPFMELLFDTIANQAKAIKAKKWTPPHSSQLFTLAIIGGSPQACVAVGINTDRVRLNSKSMDISCEQLEDALERREIVRGEEGEMMVYSAMGTMIHLGFTHARRDEGIDPIVEIHSDDCDAFAGIGMPFIYNLESTCIREKKAFSGAVYLRGPSKSVAQISNLGNIFQTNMEVDRELCPTGRGFLFFLDLIAVYYTLEDDPSLPKLPPGHRAISAVAVVYTLLNHDYLRMAGYGLTYKMVIAALKSETYKAEVSKYDPEDVSPVNFTRRSVFTNEKHGPDTGYNLRGVLLLLHHAFVNRTATNKVLIAKYKKEGLQAGVPYSTVRAAAVLAGELQPLPDPVSLLAYVSCANLIFRRWSCIMYDRTRSTDGELTATCYETFDSKGHTAMRINYSLRGLAEKRTAARDDATLIRALHASHYGPLFSDAIEAMAITIPFDPVFEVKLALKYGGYYPTVKVPADQLPDPPQLPDISEEGEDDLAIEVREQEAAEAEALATEIREMQEESLDYERVEPGDDEEDEADDRSTAGSISEHEDSSDEEMA